MVYAVGSLSLVSLLLAHRGVRIVLWIGGSAVLLWLAVKMLRETWHPRQLAVANAGDAGGKPAGARIRARDDVGAEFADLDSLVRRGRRQHHRRARRSAALLPFLSGFFFAGVCWTILIATLTGYAHRRLSTSFVRGLSLASAILFCYFAVVVFVNGYREFI